MTHTPTILEAEFSARDANSNLFHFTQVKRKGNVAIFTRIPEGKKTALLDVVRIKCHDGFEFPGKQIPAGEYYPIATAWGKDGFSYKISEKNLAHDKFCELLGIDTTSEPQPEITLEMLGLEADENSELNMMTNQTENNEVDILNSTQTPKSKIRGAKPKNVGFAFPVGQEWSIADLATKFNVSVPYVHQRVKAAGLSPVRFNKVPGKRGKSASIFKLDVEVAVPLVGAAAKKEAVISEN